MRTLGSILILFSGLMVGLGSELITATVSITNAPIGNTNTITIAGGTTRTVTNDITGSPGTLIQETNSIQYSATNLLNHYSSYPDSYAHRLSQSASNNIVIGGAAGESLSVTVVGNWASVSYVTSTIAVPTFRVRMPITRESATNQTNIASYLVQALQYSTSAIGSAWIVTSNYLNLYSNATVSGNIAFSGTNSLSDGGWNRPSITNLTIVSGTLGNLTNGYLTNATLGNPTLSNSVNYGSAFRSPGSAVGSQQFGSNATATGIQSLAVGTGAISAGGRSTAVGWGASATSTNAIAIGQAASAAGTNTIAIGRNSEAEGNDSIAIGTGAGANTTNAIAIGTGVTATESNQILLGLSTHSVRVPGQFQPTGTTTNQVLTGTNKFGSGSGLFCALAFPRYENAALAVGNNAALHLSNAVYVRFTMPAGNATNGGFAGGFDGRFILGHKHGAGTFVIANDSGIDPTAANRVYTGTGADVVITNNPGTFEIIYDSGQSRWILINHSD